MSTNTIMMSSTAIMEAPAVIQAKPKSKEVFTIQVLRAVAAILVVCRHAAGDQLAFGSIGVDIFFALSGFVMIISTGKLRLQSNAASVFLKRRIVRIVPMYWLFTGLQVLRDRAVGQHHAVKEVISSLLFVPCRFSQTPQIVYFPICTVGWTLNYEAFFYICFALCLWMRKSVFWLVPVFAVLSIIGFHRPEQSIGALSIFNYRLLLFIGGMVIAKLYAKGRLLHPIAALFVSCLCAAMVFVWHDDTYWMHMIIWAPAALAVTYAFLSFEPLFSSHRAPLLQLLGDASYSIYLSHYILGFRLAKFAFSALAMMHHDTSYFTYVLVRITLGCAAGILVHMLVERPILRLFSIRIGGHSIARPLVSHA
jgi:exopolysaccharide production protein ExoZ